MTNRFCTKVRHPPKKDDGTKRFVKCKVVGEGTYGKVYQAWDTHKEKHVAIKCFFRDEDCSIQSLLCELAAMQRCNHKNIMKFSGSIVGNDKSVFHALHNNKYIAAVVMPFMSGGDLIQFSKDHFTTDEPFVYPNGTKSFARPMPCNLALNITKQLLNALSYCHDRGMVHRDVKPQNIFIDRDTLDIKLGDFGMVRHTELHFVRSDTNQCCTIWYMPPELLLGQRFYDSEVDIWCAGIVLVELLLGKPFLAGTSMISQLYETFKVFGTPTETDWPSVKELPDYRKDFPRWRRKNIDEFVRHPVVFDLVRLLLTVDPDRRISARRALKLSVFTNETNSKTSSPEHSQSPPVVDRPEGCVPRDEFHLRRRMSEISPVRRNCSSPSSLGAVPVRPASV